MPFLRAVHKGAQSSGTMAKGRGSAVLLETQNGAAHPADFRVLVLGAHSLLLGDRVPPH